MNKRMKKNLMLFLCTSILIIVIGIGHRIPEEYNIESVLVATSTTTVATPTVIATSVTNIVEETNIIEETNITEEASTTEKETTEMSEKTTATTDTTAATVADDEAITEVFLALNPNTYRIHRSDCKYYDDSMIKLNNNYVEVGRKCTYCNPDVEIGTVYTEAITATTETTTTTAKTTTTSTSCMTFVKTFSRGTYYAYGGARTGGSGRSLIDCSWGDGAVKGSIASSYLYSLYGYDYNAKRTMVYLEVSEYSSMNGYYYLDDSDAGDSNVIDFFYYYESNCLFNDQGVVSVDCYIVNY